jgi:hypothetical protein
MRDVIFNDNDERYSENPEDLKEDVMNMTSEDLQALFGELKEPEAAHHEDHATAPHFEANRIS